MGRNFFRRIEVAFPVDDAELKARVIEEGLDIYLRDNCNAWTLDSAGDWTKLVPGDAPAVCAQQLLLAKFSQPESAVPSTGPTIASA